MSTRDDVLAAIRRNRPAGMVALPDLPVAPSPSGNALVERFAAALSQMGGTILSDEAAADLGGVTAADIAGADPASLAGIDLAVLRARFAVAETGSVALLAADLGVNALGYLAQRLLILLDPADIVETLHHAYERPEFLESNYLVLQTGPSATADIEGVLIRGAQGVRALTVRLLARQSKA